MFLHYDMEFDAAHWLPNHDGKCRYLHGHRYKLRVTLKGEPHPRTGMIVDFAALKSLLSLIIPDHMLLNDAHIAESEDMNAQHLIVWDFAIRNPTAELLAQRFAEVLKEMLKENNTDFALHSVRLWETPNGSAEVVL